MTSICRDHDSNLGYSDSFCNVIQLRNRKHDDTNLPGPVVAARESLLERLHNENMCAQISLKT